MATALAHGFLNAAEWTRAGLIAAGAELLGVRRRWLGPVAGEVLAAYRRPPIDAPRELAAVVLGCEPFARAVAKAAAQRKPIQLLHLELAPARARENRAPRVPQIDTLAHLSSMLHVNSGELEWFADPRHWNRNAGPRLRHYRHAWLQRPGRVPRLLEIPAPRMRSIQRTVLQELLYPLEIHDAAHGFVPGRGAVSGAALHTGEELVLNLDLVSFFARVTAGQVFGALRSAGYTEPVAHRLVGICTHIVPPAILSTMPSGGNPEQRFALRQALSAPHLPQGCPTSPMLANLALHRLDGRLTGLAAAFDGTYTRYADDLTFSGGGKLARNPGYFIQIATQIIQDTGHALNTHKSRVRNASQRQSVTSVVVNEHTNVSRSEFDQIKATIHNCKVYGPDSQNREEHADFRAYLAGRIAWISSVNQHRGARLLEDFQRIQW